MRNEAKFFLHFSELSPHCAWFLDNIQLYRHRYIRAIYTGENKTRLM